MKRIYNIITPGSRATINAWHGRVGEHKHGWIISDIYKNPIEYILPGFTILKNAQDWWEKLSNFLPHFSQIYCNILQVETLNKFGVSIPQRGKF